jgi:hypothetical protein
VPVDHARETEWSRYCRTGLYCPVNEYDLFAELVRPEREREFGRAENRDR